MDEPVAIMLIASAPWRVSTRRDAMIEATDQNTACAQATTSARRLRWIVGAKADRNWPSENTASTPSSIRLNSKREANTMSGNDSSMTPQA